MEGEIQHYLRDKGSTVKIPRRWLELRRRSAKVIREFRNQHNRQPNDVEIAQRLEIKIEDWQEIKLAHRNREPLSLDVAIRDDDESKTSLGELVPDPRYRSFQLAQEDRIRIQQALAQLEERTRHVLEFVFLQDLTQREAAELLGISVVTVSRRLRKGLGILKKSMGKE